MTTRTMDPIKQATLQKMSTGNLIQNLNSLKLDDNVSVIVISNNEAVSTSSDLNEFLAKNQQASRAPSIDSTDRFFSNLLKKYSPDLNGEYLSEATILGYNLRAKRTVIMIHLKDFCNRCLENSGDAGFERSEVIKSWKNRIESAINSFFTKNRDLITAYIGNGNFLVAKAVDEGEEENVKKRLISSFESIFGQLKSLEIRDITVGFGNAYENVEGLAEACREADFALKLGLKIHGENKSYAFEDFGILYTVAEGNMQKKATLADRILTGLRDENLMQTLVSFLKNSLNITDTADELQIHRNTAIYRLEQIAQRLGLDPRKFEEAVKIKIALLIRQLA